MKRKIKYIAIHCTGANQDQTVESIKRYWKENLGWKDPGYHRIIDKFGNITKLADFNDVTNGVKGFNQSSIHICYIGGQHLDNRTEEQKAKILECIHEALEWVDAPEDIIIQGHRDFPNTNKACPQFDCSEYDWITA